MRIECSIDIARAVDDVFAYVSDPCNDPLWCPKVTSVVAADDTHPQPGATYTVVHRPVPVLAPRTMAYRLVSWNPPHEIEWHADDGHDEITITYQLQAVAPEATRFAQHDQLKLGAPRPLHPLMGVGIRHDVTKQLRRLRQILESRHRP